EVLAVGDAEFQKKCLGKMGEVARSGRTVVLVSHNMAAIDGLCHRGVVIEAGQLEFAGPQTEAIRHYFQLVERSGPRGFFRESAAGSNGRGRTARIVEARVTSEGGYSPAGYPIGSPLEFRVECNAASELIAPTLGIGLDNALGQRIVTLH